MRWLLRLGHSLETVRARGPRCHSFQARRGIVKVERTDCSSKVPPIIPAQNQRMVGVDPGRRDVVVCAVAERDFNNEFDPKATLERRNVIKMSAKQHTVESKRRRAETKVKRLCRKTLVSSTQTLDVALQNLPSSKTLRDFKVFLEAENRVRDEWLRLHRKRCVRRWRFDSYAFRDQSLDRLCQKITNGEDDVIVAFGAANSCSSGFGYAPVGQKRLRHRLAAVHRARVSLIDEYKTSQKCCCCAQQLEPCLRLIKMGLGRAFTPLSDAGVRA